MDKTVDIYLVTPSFFGPEREVVQDLMSKGFRMDAAKDKLLAAEREYEASIVEEEANETWDHFQVYMLHLVAVNGIKTLN